MDKDFYNLAVRLMANISRVEPNLVSGHDAEMCVILTDQQHVYAGITGVRISNGQLMRACPEFNAIMSMVPAGESRVDKMITVSFANHSVSPPCEGCLELLLRVNADNKDTKIFDGPNHYVNPDSLMHDESLSDQLADMFFFAEGNHAIVGGVATIPTPPPAPAEEKTAPVEEAASAEEAAPAEEAASTEETAPAEEAVSAEEAPTEENPFAEEASEEAPPVQALGESEAPAANEPAGDAGSAEGLSSKVDGSIPGASSMMNRPAGIPEAAAMAIADAVAAAEGEHAADPDDQFAQFGFEAGDPVDFVEEVKHDEDNPFYEPPVDPAEQDATLPPYMRDPRAQQPRYLYEQPQYDSMQQPAMGYEDPQSSMYASQQMPGGGRRKGLFQPGQQAAMRTAQMQSQQMSQYTQSQYVSQQFQPQEGQTQEGQSQYVSQQFGQGQSQYLSAQPPQPGQSQYVSQQLRPAQSTLQPLRGGAQTGQTFRPGQGQPSQPQAFRPGQTQPSQPQPFRPGQSGQSQTSMYAQQPMQGVPYVPQGGTQPRRESGSAFRQRLSIFMKDDGGADGADMTQSEMMRLAKEKKKKAKIDAQFKKDMKKKGF